MPHSSSDPPSSSAALKTCRRARDLVIEVNHELRLSDEWFFRISECGTATGACEPTEGIDIGTDGLAIRSLTQGPLLSPATFPRLSELLA